MGISNFYKRVCYFMFKDILEERNIKLEDQQGEGIVQASCSKVGGTETVESSGPSVPFKLNPFAKEWNPLKDRANESDRCLFLTFSNGYPLNESQIVNFFTQKFGACIERVYVHWENRTDEKMPPLFGKVVFDASYVPASILKGEKEAKFMVEGKPLWCKEFVQKKKKRERN
ncbi:hypothetical protein K2173_011345 [Erythroxylum novogranatense]|uniref:Uncharacterized protein n=1 Tax=Erythroxylum novogranatense TaxID=1862640 RepID=A0AAV8S4Q9_9ROSI|nr:hypothetical protein K2173_011345 [Erythroxylum novogranatense]